MDFDKSDIDWNKTRDNIFLIQTEHWNKEITKVTKQIESETGKKTRKDAVVLLDGLFTASPEFFEDKILFGCEYKKNFIEVIYEEKNFG